MISNSRTETENQQLKIVIVDSDCAASTVVEDQLISLLPDVEIVKLASIADLRRFLTTTKTDLIQLLVMAQHLPDGTGINLLHEGVLEKVPVILVSAENSPKLAGASILAGAAYFLPKSLCGDPCFKSLARGVIDRGELQRALDRVHIDAAVMSSVKAMLATLNHEINNPLGAVLGATYLLKRVQFEDPNQKRMVEQIESSGKRIKHVIAELAKATALDLVSKGRRDVFQVPGDKPWEEDED
ncbi:hypothetical protein OAO01_03675 [Oligoflexia bacterium]|nr:hypothetical protein [Oligoflexia bacterium]